VLLANQRQNQAPAAQEARNKNVGVRALDVSAIRAVEGAGNERRFILSFSSEVPYRRWFGMEVLDHKDGAVDLSRLNTVGVVLFNHDTYKVLGKVIRSWVENKRGQAEVEFDTDEDAEVIYQKVKGGTLKTTSVRYTIDVWEEVAAGKTSTDGFAGPCEIARKWTPLEISIVSVPADATVGVGRDMEDDTEQKEASMIGVYERQITINKNFLGGN
jgi:phage head maturation protease